MNFRQDWNDYDRAADKGPLALLVKIVILLTIVGVLIGGIGYVLGWFGEGAQVVQEEFGPRGALNKYEWFKDASAQLDAKRANIGASETRLKGLEDSYMRDGQPLPRSQWARTDLETYNQIQAEIAGMKASYNDLAAQYNAAMKKFNYRFANRGELPEGATDPLPREYKPYIGQ